MYSPLANLRAETEASVKVPKTAVPLMAPRGLFGRAAGRKQLDFWNYGPHLLICA